MSHTTPHTLNDCFAIIDTVLSPSDKQAIANAGEFELRYVFHNGLENWIKDNVVLKYDLRGTDFFMSHNIWQQILLSDDPNELSAQILLAYRHHLLTPHN